MFEFSHITSLVLTASYDFASCVPLCNPRSFYHLPSTVIGHEKHSTLFAAYSFYNVATSMTLTALMKDALTLARNKKTDVFNALNLMDNEEFLKELLFGIGDGHLQYYLYNWQCPGMQPREAGLVLL